MAALPDRSLQSHRCVGAQTCTSSADGHAPKRRKLTVQPPAAVVLDIEGTVAPLALTKDVLFPYARAHLREHLASTWTTAETQSDVDQLVSEVRRLAALSHRDRPERRRPGICRQHKRMHRSCLPVSLLAGWHCSKLRRACPEAAVQAIAAAAACLSKPYKALLQPL